MKILPARNVRTRLTLWYVSVLAIVLALYIALVFAFQYALLERQMYHDEVQDVETVEGLLAFDQAGTLQLQQDYYSHPQSHLLIDRLMEVRDLSGAVLYRSETLNGMSLGGSTLAGEGDGKFNQRIVKLSDGTHVFLISHVHSMQGRTVLIRLGYSLSAFYDRMSQFFILLLIALPVALVVAGFAGFGIAKKALQPLEQMAERAEHITASNLHDRLEIENEHDELGHMARVFNQLLQRLEEAFEQLKRFTADAAHELRTPLSSLRTVGEVALQQSTRTEDYREAIGSILEETDRLNHTIEGLLLLAKTEASFPVQKEQLIFLPELVDEILATLGVLIEERNLSIVEDRKGLKGSSVKADRNLVRVALMNVFHNAVKFSPDDSTLTVTCTIAPGFEDFAEVSIQDEGPGLAIAEHRRVFDRFFTSSRKETAFGSGTGLGLSIAKLAVERSGGQIFFDETVNCGARCVIYLPLDSSADLETTAAN
jgi:signal transduction histidine kinase